MKHFLMALMLAAWLLFAASSSRQFATARKPLIKRMKQKKYNLQWRMK
jgi:hypothetical protein